MDQALLQIVLDRMERDQLDGDVELLVFGACDGPGALEQALGGEL